MKQSNITMHTAAVALLGATLALVACGDSRRQLTPGTVGVATSSSAGGGTVSSSGAGGAPAVGLCVGVEPSPDAYARKPGPVIDASGGAGGMGTTSGSGGSGGSGGSAMPADPKEVGAVLPNYQLEDIQPISCGYQGVYGPELFGNKVMVVVLLAAWCGFCQAQASFLEQMRVELDVEGYGDKVQFLIINKSDALDEQAYLVKRCSIPILQDVETVQGWLVHHQGYKDDFFIYGSDGKLAHFLRESEEVNVNLSTDEGYKTVKDAILATVGK